MISASHNPIEWNALKFIGPTGLFLENAEGIEMRSLVERGIPRAQWDELGKVETDDRAVQRHIDRVLAIPYVDVDAIRAPAIPRRARLRSRRGRRHHARAARSAGLPGDRDQSSSRTATFRVRRSRWPENLGDLERLVLESGAAIGFAVDPDVDRLALVSDAGKAIGEDFTLALAAKLVLRHRTGPVVTNLSTSRIVEDVANAAGTARDPGAGGRGQRSRSHAR